MDTKTVICYEYSGKYDHTYIHTETHLFDESGEYLCTKRHTESFVPGDIERMKTFLGDEKHPIAMYIETLWTPDVITKQEARHAQVMAELNNENEAEV